MKRVLLSLVILICIVSFVAPAFAMKNEPDNFRGIPWGTPTPSEKESYGSNKWGLVLDDLDYLSLFSQKAYERKNDELSINGAKIDTILYVFQESLGFARVQVTFSGFENYKLIRKAIFSQWGNPDESWTDILRPYRKLKKFNGDEKEDYNYESMTYYWIGKRVLIRLFHENNSRHDGCFEIYLRDYFEAFDRDNEKYFQEPRGF